MLWKFYVQRVTAAPSRRGSGSELAVGDSLAPRTANGPVRRRSRRTRYSPLTDHRAISRTEVAWRFKPTVGARRDYTSSPPLMVKGCGTDAGTRRAVVALNPAPASCWGCTPRRGPRGRSGSPPTVGTRLSNWGRKQERILT